MEEAGFSALAAWRCNLSRESELCAPHESVIVMMFTADEPCSVLFPSRHSRGFHDERELEQSDVDNGTFENIC